LGVCIQYALLSLYFVGEDSMLMASAGIVSPKKVKSVSTSPNDGLDMPIIDLGNTEPTSHNWITFNPLDNT